MALTDYVPGNVRCLGFWLSFSNLVILIEEIRGPWSIRFYCNLYLYFNSLIPNAEQKKKVTYLALLHSFSAPDQDEHAAERWQHSVIQYDALRSHSNFTEHQATRKHECKWYWIKKDDQTGLAENIAKSAQQFNT